MILDINIKVDVEDLVQCVDEDTTLNDVIKERIIRGVVDRIVKDATANMSDLRKKTEDAYRQRLDNYVNGMAQNSEWLIDHLNSNAYAERLSRLMSADVAKKLADALRNDPAFIRAVAEQAFKTK